MKNPDPLEKVIEAAVCKYAQSKGCLVYKFTSPSRSAVCDRIFMCRGKVWFIEFKRGGEKATPAQSRHHQELVRHDITVYVVDSINMGKEIVDYETQQTTSGHHWSAIRYISCGSTITRKEHP